MSLILASFLVAANAAPVSPLEFTWKLQRATLSRLDRVALGSNTKKTEGADFRAATTWWCPHANGAKSLDDVVEAYDAYCRSRGGILENAGRDAPGNHYCRKSESSDTVLFVVRANEAYKCKTLQTVSVTVVEPKESASAPGYVNAISALGYQSRAQRQAQEERRFNEASKRALTTVDRLEHERPAKRQIGTQVCRVEGGIRYAGWVERVEGDRVQVRVGSAVLVNSPSLSPPGWEPQLIWASIDTWTLC
jgi:hypothetical protein